MCLVPKILVEKNESRETSFNQKDVFVLWCCLSLKKVMERNFLPSIAHLNLFSCNCCSEEPWLRLSVAMPWPIFRLIREAELNWILIALLLFKPVNIIGSPDEALFLRTIFFWLTLNKQQSHIFHAGIEPLTSRSRVTMLASEPLPTQPIGPSVEWRRLGATEAAGTSP